MFCLVAAAVASSLGLPQPHQTPIELLSQDKATVEQAYDWITEDVQGYNSFFGLPHEERKMPWELVDTAPEDLVFAEHPDFPRVHHPDGSEEATFYSSLRSLAPGEVVFTDPDRTHMPMPEGDIAITSVEADIVDADHKAVPLDEVYLHHWILLNKKHPNDGVCGGYLKYVFGVGAETRKTPYNFPEFNGDKYGWFTNQAKQPWTANIHVLRTVDIDPEWGLKGCIECHGPTKWCKKTGGFECCPDRSFCPTTENPSPAKQYYFRYKVKFVPQSEAKQAANYILDVSHPKCNIEYNVPANPRGIDEATVQVVLPHDTRFFQLWGHIHIAGYNISLFHGKTTADPLICASYPTYGTREGVVGEEKGYVTAMSKCDFGSKPYVIKKGEPLTLSAVYNVGPEDDRTWNTGYHDGVMGLYFMVGEKCKSTGCVDEGDAPRTIEDIAPEDRVVTQIGQQ